MAGRMMLKQVRFKPEVTTEGIMDDKNVNRQQNTTQEEIRHK